MGLAHARRWLPLLAGVVSVALVASACGDDDGPATGQAQDQEGATSDASSGEPIPIGYPIYVNPQLGSEIGTGSTKFDPRAQADVMVGYVNEHGGLGGRPVKPEYLEVDPTDPSATAQVCSHYTEDVEIVAIIGPAGNAETLRCFTAAGIPIFAGTATSTLDDEDYDNNLVFTTGLSLNALARGFVEFMDDEGFLDGGTIGVVTGNSDAYTRVLDDTLLPALEDAGVEVAETVEVSGDGADIQKLSSELAPAVLRLRDADVDKVVMFDAAGRIGLFFPRIAGPQGYNPEVFDTPAQTMLLTTDTPGVEKVDPALLANMTGLGVVPYFEVNEPDHPAGNPQTDACWDILTEGGVTPAADRLQQWAQVAACDSWLFLQAAFNAADGDFSVDGVTAGVEALDDTYNSPNVIGESTVFGPGKHWGMSLARGLDFHDDCECFRYNDTEVTLEADR